MWEGIYAQLCLNIIQSWSFYFILPPISLYFTFFSKRPRLRQVRTSCMLEFAWPNAMAPPRNIDVLHNGSDKWCCCPFLPFPLNNCFFCCNVLYYNILYSIIVPPTFHHYVLCRPHTINRKNMNNVDYWIKGIMYVLFVMFRNKCFVYWSER